MKLSVLLPTFLIGSATAAAVLETRATNDYAKVVADIKTIKSQLATVTSDVKSFTANDFAGSFKILQDSMTLENDITGATSDANSSAPFGNKGSAAVAQAVLNLQKPIKVSLNTIIKKKPEFDKGIFGIPLSPIVLNTLQTLKTDTDNFGAAIVAKLSKTYQQAAPGIIKSIDAEFDKAISTYGG